MKFLHRVIAKLSRIWFQATFSGRFGSLGKKAFIFSPFRVDGIESVVLGNATVFQKGAWLYCGSTSGSVGQIRVGNDCVFGYNNHITAVKSVLIGNAVLTANNVYISDNLHGFEDVSQPIMHQPVKFKREVIVGDGSWIGENACIIGAHVGKNCVIGANAVVTKDIPDFSVAVGVPARVIRQYDVVRREWMTVPPSGEQEMVSA